MKGNETLWRKGYAATWLAALVLSLCKPQMLAAQRYQTYAMFGNGTSGQSRVIGPSMFGGIPTGPNGRSLAPGRFNGVAQIATGWRTVGPVPSPLISGVTPVAQPALNATAQPQMPAPESSNPGQGPIYVPVFVPLTAGTNGTEVMIAGNQTLGAQPAIEMPAVANSLGPQSGTTAVSDVSRGVPAPFRLAELSARLTRIARSKGIIAGQGIDVSMNNNVAVLQGTVRTPGDAVLLGNLLALEPGVRRIDNQLTVAGAVAP